MIEIILELARIVIWWYNLLVLAYLVLEFVRIPANKWTELLRSAVEPALQVTRKLMDRFLPQLRKPGFDWSPVVLFVANIVIRWILRIL